MPLKSGNKQNSSRENRKVRAASGGWKPPEGAGTLPGFDSVGGALGAEPLQSQGKATPWGAGIAQAGCWGCQGGVGVVT